MKKISSLLFLTLAFTVLLLPTDLVSAATINCPDPTTGVACTDADGDGWVLYSPSTPYKDDSGKKCKIKCNAVGGVTLTKKGGGDCIDDPAATIDGTNGKTYKAKDIHPEAIPVPGSGVDMDCSGSTGGYTESPNMDVQKILDNIKNFLIWIVGSISGIILIWGGIMYATAAGEEQKQKKARKAMIGAVIGLIVAILSSLVISIIAERITQ